MDKVTSRDGTRIACWSAGSGPPVLLVHGGMADHTRWSEVSPLLEERFTVFTMDRRGRGESEDGLDYAMEREYEDIVAILESIGAPTTIVGHSYGAGCALGAALLTDRVERLVLYEPGILEGAKGYYAGDRIAAALRKAEKQLRAGETEPAMVTIFRDVIEMSDQEVEMVRSSPTWPQRVAAAHTVLREIREEAAYLFDPVRYRDLTVPTLLLTGSESYQIARGGTAALHDALPNSRVVVLQGQGHVAITTAPELFVREVMAFLSEPWRAAEKES